MKGVVTVFSTMSIAPLDRAKWDHVPDEELVRRVRDGDTALYEILMRRHNQRIYRVALNYLAERRGSRRRDARGVCPRLPASRRLCGEGRNFRLADEDRGI